MYPHSRKSHTDSQMAMVLVESYEVHRHGAWKQKGDYITSNGYHKMAALGDKETIGKASGIFPLAQKHCEERSITSIYKNFL